MSLRIIRSAAFVLLMAICLASLPRPTVAGPRATKTAVAQLPNLSAWQDIISFRPPDNVQRIVAGRAFVLPAYVHRLERGLGEINLDYYSINIDRLPNNPATGRQFTSTEFLEHVRLNINSFVDTNYAQFNLYDPARDGAWNTNSPVGAMLSIKLSNVPYKTATVATAAHSLSASNSYWTFSTAYTPNDQAHPVSGNRQFGLRWDGTRYVFYTRAADRITDGVFLAQEVAAGTVFGNGDLVWRGLQQRVASYVQNNGGSATIIPRSSTRYNWTSVCPLYWYPSTAWFDNPPGTPVRVDGECRGWNRTWVPIGQMPNYMTGIQIQNPTSSTATVFMTYYRSDGVPALTNTFSVQPGSSYTSIDQGPAGFQGGVMVEANTAVTVASNLLNRTNQTLSSANAFEAGSPKVDLPLLMRNNYGYSSWFAIQNTHWNTVDATITYYGASGAIYSTTVTIPAGASRFFYQAGDTRLPSGFVGSAQVRATGAVAVTVLQETTTRLLSYNGFIGGSANTTLNAPILMANNYGYNSGIQVQNLGSYGTTVTVNYAPNTVTTQSPNQPPPCTRYPASRQRGVAPGSSVTIGQNGAEDAQFANCVYVGGATITADQPIVATVNQVGTIGASAYEAVNPVLAGNRVQLPLLQGNNFRVNSGVQIQNVGSSGQYFTFSYGPNNAQPVQNAQGYLPCASVPGPRSYYIPAGASVTVLQQPDFPSCIYVGGATITGPSGSRVAATVNQQGGDYVDKLSTYVGR